MVKNDGKAAVGRIALTDIVDEKGKVIVPEKTLITDTSAKEIKSKVKTEEIEVRGFLGDAYQYYDAYEERDLVIAEANTTTDEFGNFTETRLSARPASEATVV